MDVEEAARSDGEHFGRQELAVGRDDAEVRLSFAQRLDGARTAQRGGLQHRDLVLPRRDLDGWWGEHLLAADGLVRLTDSGDDLDRRVGQQEAAQHGGRELRRAHEQGAWATQREASCG